MAVTATLDADPRWIDWPRSPPGRWSAAQRREVTAPIRAMRIPECRTIVHRTTASPTMCLQSTCLQSMFLQNMLRPNMIPPRKMWMVTRGLARAVMATGGPWWRRRPG